MIKNWVFDFSHVLGDFLENISRWSMWPSREIVGVENIPREISYEVGHSRVSLDLPFNLEILQLK